MFLNSLGRAILAVAILASVKFLPVGLPTTDHLPGRGSLAGQLLIAARGIGDPRFDHAVILVVRHSQGGAMGLVINRPVGERPLASLLADDSITRKVRVLAGGPVQPEIGFVVHSTDYRRSETIDIDGRVAVTSTAEILRDIARDEGPKQSLVAFGYAGWGPGQLENELEGGTWFTAPEDPVLVFDEDREKLWERAMSRRTKDL